MAIHCKPDKPSSSALLEPDIESLLQNRAPAAASESFALANSVPQWIRPFLWVFVLLFWHRSRRQLVGSSGSRDGTACGTGSILLDVACWNLYRVAPSRPGCAETCREPEPEGFMEGHFEGFARLDALYGVRLFWLRRGQFPVFHDEGSQWR